MSPLAALYLAQAAPAAVDAATTVSQATPLLVGIMALSVFVNQALGAFNNFRKLKGADPTTAANSEATEKKFKQIDEDIRAVELRMERRMGEHLGAINTRFQHFENTMGQLVGDFNRSLGRLEGKAESGD
jgi:hypothetical protein